MKVNKTLQETTKPDLPEKKELVITLVPENRKDSRRLELLDRAFQRLALDLDPLGINSVKGLTMKGLIGKQMIKYQIFIPVPT